MVDLDRLAYKQFRISNLLKKLDGVKKEIRSELFAEANEDFQKKDWLLPTVTHLVPWKFFEKTEMESSDFIKTRFPQWNIESSQETEEGLVFILKKKPEYMPWSYASDEFEISRSVAELTPEVDWDTMQKADPDFFEMFAKEVKSYELDVEAFNAYMNTHPEFAGAEFLVRHTKHKAPTLRVLSKEVNKENG